MTQILTTIGLVASIIKDWLVIFKDIREGERPFFPNKSRRYIAKGDQYDAEGMYEKALVQFNQVLVLDHRNIRAYLRKINVLVRLNRFSEASEFLAKADRYARKPKHWFWISNLHFVIKMEEFRLNPSLETLRTGHKHLEEAELEQENMVLFGRFVTSSLEGLWRLSSLSAIESQQLETTARYYLQQMKQAEKKEGSTSKKYFDQFSREIAGYLLRMDKEKLSRRFFWENFLEEYALKNLDSYDLNHHNNLSQ